MPNKQAGLATLLLANHPGRGLPMKQMEQADALLATTVPGGGQHVEHGAEQRSGTTGEGNS